MIESLKDPTLQAQLESRLTPLQTLLSRLFPSNSSSSSSSPLVNLSVSSSLGSALELLRIERDDLLQKYESVVLELEGVKHKCDRWKLEFERVQKGEPSEAERAKAEGVKGEDDKQAAGSAAAGETSGEGQRLLKEEGDKATLEDRIAGVSSVAFDKFSGNTLTRHFSTLDQRESSRRNEWPDLDCRKRP